MSQQEHREKVRACRPAPAQPRGTMEGGGANDDTKEASRGSEGCFVSDQRRGTCQLGCGTVTLLKKGEEESREEH